MNSNKLALNLSKTQIMCITKYASIRNNFKVKVEGVEFKHMKKIKIVGNVMNEDLNWNSMITGGNESVLNQLKARNFALSKVTPYLDDNMKKSVVNGIFRGKLLFGIETWAATSKMNIKVIESEQNKMTKLALNKKFANKSYNQRLKQLNWLPIEAELDFATDKITHKIINTGIPAEMHALMPINSNQRWIQAQMKLGSKPKNLMK